MERVHYRSIDASAYKPVSPLDEFESQHDVFTTTDAPFVFFVATRWTRNGEHWGGNPTGVWRVDLATGERTQVAPGSGFKVEGEHEEAFVSSILALDARGETAVLTLGVKRRASSEGFQVDYAAFKVHFEGGRCERIVGLPAVFL